MLRNGQASTLDIVKEIKAALPRVRANLPKALQITPLFDQSIFVRASMYGVLREGMIAALLAALMILIFLGSWRSTLIVCSSIPLPLLTSQVILSALGQSINNRRHLLVSRRMGRIQAIRMAIAVPERIRGD